MRELYSNKFNFSDAYHKRRSHISWMCIIRRVKKEIKLKCPCHYNYKCLVPHIISAALVRIYGLLLECMLLILLFDTVIRTRA